jgi:phosphatidylglycerophosphatase C
VSEQRGTSPVPAVVAAFDFDGTLTNGGSVFPFLVSVRGWFPVLAAVLRTAPQLLAAALFGGSAADDAKEKLFVRLLQGLDEGELDRVSAEFAQRHLRVRLRPEMRERVDWHRAQGHLVLIVSASPECYVRPAGDLLAVDGVLATRLAVGGHHKLTGHYSGKNCRGPEKFARVEAWLRANGLAANGSSAPQLWAYGNSRGDLRLLRAADRGFDAGRLGRFGALREFPSLQAPGHGHPEEH